MFPSFFTAALLTFVPLASSATIYVSPTGSSSGTGSSTSPLASIQSAVNLATAGSTIYLRAGTYSLTSNVQIKKNCTAAAPCTLSAYGSEKVIVDGEALTGTPADYGASLANSDRGILHIENAWYWNFIGIELINGPYGIYQRDSSNNYYERIVTRDNYETGFQIQGIAANNEVVYLDSYGNRDPRKNGESADGFGLKEGSGTGNIIRGARLWNNVDDGLDLWEFKSAITIQDTLSWGNGFNRWSFTDFEGDGNGFKLGGGDEGDIGPANHVVKNCMAFNNAADGFTDNSQTGTFTITYNTAWNNTGTGFSFKTAVSTLTKNIATSNDEAQYSLSSSQTASGNSWNVGGTWDDASFESTDVSLVSGSRLSSGKIAQSDFLLPKSSADLGATTEWE